MVSRKSHSVLAFFVAFGVIVSGPSSLYAGEDKPVKPAADPVKPGEKPAKPDKPAADPAKPGEKPAKPDGVKSPAVSGTLKAIDVDKGTLVVSKPAKNGGTSDETFTTDADTKVVLDGKESKLASLKTGLPVAVKLSQDRAKAIGISVEGPTVSGEVKEVNAAKHTVLVKVTVRPDKTDKTKTVTEDKTFKVADDAPVSVPGQKKATLADLKVGTNISVRTSSDGERAIGIQSVVKSGPTLSGELKEVAADKKSVKVAVLFFAVKGDKNSAKTEEKSIKLADDIKVVVDGRKQAALSDLKTGTNVTLQMSLEGDKAIAISSNTKGSDKKPEKPVKPGSDK